MATSCHARPTCNPVQFTLRSLFECVSLCAVPAAFASKIGVLPTALLIGLNLALAARQGFVALLTLIGASLVAADGAGPTGWNGVMEREFLALVIGVALVGWYRFRRGGWQECS